MTCIKKCTSVLLAAFLFFLPLLTTSVPVKADSLYIKKIVSVVYDDSTSMNGEKWAYANYAMQTFCGMLNEEDQLFVTYMSEIKPDVYHNPPEVDLSSENIQSSVDSIRKHNDRDSTPYGSVSVAYNKLSSIKDDNPNTQYWLVVITDGSFNELAYSSSEAQKAQLDKDFAQYANSTMPNGSHPQITFMTIGNNAVSPTEDKANGIYTYDAASADTIIAVMSEMAERISGRTSIHKTAIKQIGPRTLQVSSDIPLLNIAVLAQDTDAVIEKAVYSNEVPLQITRKAVIGYPSYAELSGGAFLIGDTSKIIGRGTYNITFDRDITPNEVDVLFEPALEVRMSITLNGKEVKDLEDLNNSMEKDKISVSYKIYEMDTNKEVDSSLLPPGTEFSLTVTENGSVVQEKKGADKKLSDYELDNVKTEIKAAVKIAGFDPIEYSVRFTPTEYVHRIVYTMAADFGGGPKSVKYDEITANKDVSVYFTVFADGNPITDPEEVKALSPVVSSTPSGNYGTVDFSNDGKIIYTPNAASNPPSGVDYFDVDVTCTLNDGTSATEKYTVLIAEYVVVAVPTTEQVIKTDFYGNKVGVSFYITKDGQKLRKSEIENGISVSLNETQGEFLTYRAEISEDGTVTVVPYAEEEHKLDDPIAWMFNWWYYFFGVSGDDVCVAFNHQFGSASATIDVIGQTLLYQLLCVYLPLLLEIAMLVILACYVYCLVTKPKFGPSAVLYVGELTYRRPELNDGVGVHIINELTKYNLSEYNKIKFCFPPKKGLGIDRYGRLQFKRDASVVDDCGVSIKASRGGCITCVEAMPWYKGAAIPAVQDYSTVKDPAIIAEKHSKFKIEEFVNNERIDDEYKKDLLPCSDRTPKYIVVPSEYANIEDRRVIKSGKIFIYRNE